jgi:hypothetical protein
MFFTSERKVRAAETAAMVDALLSQKEEIKKRLEEINVINDQLHSVVSETQLLSLSVMKKLKGELKVAKKSIISICKKLREGIVLLDWQGNVVQINDAAEKMFSIYEKPYLNKPFTDLIKTMDFGHDCSLPHDELFFKELSNRILNKIHCTDHCESCTGTKSCTTCTSDKIKSELPSFFDLENEIVTQIVLNKGGKPFRFGFSFSMLDNDPERITDVIYIFLFKELSKTKVVEKAYA